MNSLDSSTGIFTTDTDLVVRTWDDWMERSTGIGAPQARGYSLVQLFPSIEQRGLLTRLERVIANGAVEVLAPAFHYYLIPCAPLAPSKHFEKMQQYVTIAPLLEGDQIIGLIVTVEDVTARLDRQRDLTDQLTSPDEATRLRAAQALAEEPTQSADEALAATLGDDSWCVRRVAASGLSRPGCARIVTALLREGHLNFSVLSSALQVLGLSDEDILEPLVELLDDQDANLRVQTALLLGERRDKRAAHALIRALDDKDKNVRYHAIEALGKIGALDAVDALVAVAESRDFFLAFPALDALARINDPRAASRIAPLLSDELLRSPAAEALGRLGDEETAGQLITLLNQPQAPAEVIARSLAAIYRRSENLYREGSEIAELARRSIDPTGAQSLLAALNHASTDELAGLVIVLGWLEGTAVERALTRLLGQPSARKEVIEALIRHGDRVTELLIEQLAAEDLDTRQAAIIALGRIGDSRATPALVRVLTEDEESIIITASALAKLGDRRAFEPLLGLLSHQDASVRQAVISALNSLGHPDMNTRILKVLTDLDPLVRESAVKIAGYFGYPECLELILERCHDAEENVRCAALENIPYLEDPRILQTLSGALQQESPRVRAAAARAFGYVEGASAWPYLREALTDDDDWVRYFAVRSLGRHGLPEALNELADLAQRDVAPQVRIAAIESLGETGVPQVVEILAPLTEAEDLDLARAAIKALGSVEHPQALNTLLAARLSPDAERRLAVVHALANRNEIEAVDLLKWIAAADGDERVVQAAIDGLRQSASKEAIDSLIALTADVTCREACINALVQMGEKSIPEIARGLTQAHVEVRRAMIEVLGRMKHPQALEHLQMALNDSESCVRMAAITALVHSGSRGSK